MEFLEKIKWAEIKEKEKMEKEKILNVLKIYMFLFEKCCLFCLFSEFCLLKLWSHEEENWVLVTFWSVRESKSSLGVVALSTENLDF